MDIKPIHYESRLKEACQEGVLEKAVSSAQILNDKFAIRLGENYNKHMYYIVQISPKMQRFMHRYALPLFYRQLYLLFKPLIRINEKLF